MLATRTARWAVMTALVCLVLAAASWLLLVSPRLATAADVRDQTATARSHNDALELEIAQLKAQYAELPEKKAELAAIHAQMPAAAAMPELVKTLAQIATATGVTLEELTPSAASELAAPTTAATATSTAPTEGVGTTAKASVAGPTVVVIPIALSVQGDYFEVVAFLKKLQTEIPRIFLVNMIKVGEPDGEAAKGTVSLHIGGQVFALPDAQTDAASTNQSTAAQSTTAPTTAEGATTS